MGSLTDTQKRGLFSLLTGVDAQSTVVSSGNPAKPELVRPVGSVTDRDTGAPFLSFFKNFAADTATDIQSRTILLVVAGVIGILGVFAIAKKAF